MNIADLLAYLWPDFSGIPSGRAASLTAWFWMVMFMIFVIATIAVIRHYLAFRRRHSGLRSLLKGQTKNTLASSRRDLVKRADSLTALHLGALWREFDESLVHSKDHSQLFNTLDAAHFFNSATLAGGITGSRLLAATPSFLVALGVLGTFVGLTYGLVGLQVNSDEVEKLKDGINQMIQGASVAFLTSVWGVVFSLVLNLFEKLAERDALAKISRLQRDIDFMYPRIPAEQSLVHIADHTRESAAALQELHERIGDRLQESIQGMSDAVQQALTDTLNNIVVPAMSSLVRQMNQQSSEALESLVTRLMGGMGNAGREQGALMEQAAASVKNAVDGMSSQLSQLMQSLNEQQQHALGTTAQQAASYDKQLQRIGAQSDARELAMEQGFHRRLVNLTGQIDGQMNAAEQREASRQQRFEGQIEAVGVQQQELLRKLMQSLNEQQQQTLGTTEQQAAHFEKQLQRIGAQSDARELAMEQSFHRRLINLTGQIDGQMNTAEQREASRQQRFEGQLEAVGVQQQELLRKLMQSLNEQQQQTLGTTEQQAAHFEKQLQRIGAQSDARELAMEQSFHRRLINLTGQIDGQMYSAEQREASRQQRFEAQLAAVTAQQQELLQALAAGVQATQQQSLQLASQHEALMQRLQQVTESVMQSSRHMDSSANQLGLLSTNVRQAADALGQRLEGVAAQVQAAAARNQEVAAQVQAQATALRELQGALLDGAQRSEETTRLARDGFKEMQQHQKDFLAGVSREFTQLGGLLRAEVEGLEKQAHDWLQSYSNEVRSQVQDRMEQWNTVSMAYADQMLNTVRAISSVVDELESR